MVDNVIFIIASIILILVGLYVYLFRNAINPNNKVISMSFKESLDLTDLPIVTFYNNGCRYNFILDTGANLSVINSAISDSLKHEKVNAVGSVFGMEGNPTSVNYIKAPLEYKGTTYEELFQVIDMSTPFGRIKEESGVLLHGILGNAFFTKYKYVLDFENLIAYSKHK